MSNKSKYKQCYLERGVFCGIASQTAWIPSKYAIVGDTVKIKQEDDTWQDGWVVKTVSEEEIDDPIDLHKAIREHRKNTGDSLQKCS